MNAENFLPLISVIIPVYNNSWYLEECIGSVIGQSFRDLEIIIVDDGSTDPLAKSMLRNFAERDGRIRLVTKENTGYGHSMNIGLAMARGVYIGIVESDDYIHEDMYKILASVAESGEPDIVKGHYAKFEDNGEGRSFSYVSVIPSKKRRAKFSRDKRDYITGPLSIQNGIYKREFLLENDIKFNETPGASFQDIGFFCKTAALANDIRIVNETVYYLRRDNPLSSIYDKNKVYFPVYEYKELFSFLERKGINRASWIYYMTLKKFRTCIFTLNRVGEANKEIFKDIFIDEWRKARAGREIDYALFNESELEWIRENLEKEPAPEIIPADNGVEPPLLAEIRHYARGSYRSWQGWQRRLRIAAMLEESSAWEPEAVFLRLSDDNFLKELEDFKPQLFIMDKIPGRAEGAESEISPAIMEILNWCKAHAAPAVFIFRRGAAAFNHAAAYAALFDYTASEEYEEAFRLRELLGSDRVFYLPPGVQQREQNPIGRREGAHAAGIFNSARTMDFERQRRKADFEENLAALMAVENINEENAASKNLKYRFNFISGAGSSALKAIFGQMASGSLVLTDFDPILSPMLGDLVISGGRGVNLAERLKYLEYKPARLDRVRLAALREVMRLRLMEDRLRRLLGALGGAEPPEFSFPIMVLSRADSAEDCASIIKSFQRQEWKNKKLVIFKPPSLNYDGPLFGDALLLNDMPVNKALFGFNGMAAIFHPSDFYGTYYLTDLALAARYWSHDAAGKNAFYSLIKGRPALIGKDAPYSGLSSLSGRRALFKPRLLQRGGLGSQNIYDFQIRGNCLNIDPYNYCEGGARASAKKLAGLSEGRDLFAGADENILAEKLKGAPVRRGFVSGGEFLLLKPAAQKLPQKARLEAGVHDSTDISCNYEQGEFDYITSGKKLPLRRFIKEGAKTLFIHAAVLPGENVFFNYKLYNAQGRLLGSEVIRVNEDHKALIPEGAAAIQLNLRLSKKGREKLIGVFFRPLSRPMELMEDTGAHLLLCKSFPSSQSPDVGGREALWIASMRRKGLVCDVFQLSPEKGWDFFDGARVLRGGLAELKELLQKGRIKNITVFSLDEDIWRHIKDFAGALSVIVRLEEPEILRQLQSARNQELAGLKKGVLAKSAAFWRSFLESAPSGVRLVFRSRRFAALAEDEAKKRLVRTIGEAAKRQARRGRDDKPRDLKKDSLKKTYDKINSLLAGKSRANIRGSLEELYKEYKLINTKAERGGLAARLVPENAKEHDNIAISLKRLPLKGPAKIFRKRLCRALGFNFLFLLARAGGAKTPKARVDAGDFHEYWDKKDYIKAQLSSAESLHAFIYNLISIFKFSEAALLGEAGALLYPDFKSGGFNFLAARCWLLAGEAALSIISLFNCAISAKPEALNIRRFRMNILLEKRAAPLDWQKLIAELALTGKSHDPLTWIRLSCLAGEGEECAASIEKMADPEARKLLFDYLLEIGALEKCAVLIDKPEPDSLLNYYLNIGDKDNVLNLLGRHERKRLRIRNANALHWAYQRKGDMKKAFTALGAPAPFHLLRRLFPDKAVTSLEGALPPVKNGIIFSEWFLADELFYSQFYPRMIKKMNCGACAVTCDHRVKGLLQRTYPDINFIPVRKARELEFIDDFSFFDKLPHSELTHYMDNGMMPRLGEADRIISSYHGLTAAVEGSNIGGVKLKPDPDLAKKFSRKIQELLKAKGKKTAAGLSWRSSITGADRDAHVISFKLIEELLKLNDILWINCQYDGLKGQEKALFAKHKENFITLNEVDQYNDVESAAALYSALDIMVSHPSFSGVLAGLCGTRALFHCSSARGFTRNPLGSEPYFLCGNITQRNFRHMKIKEAARWIGDFIKKNE